MRFGKSYKRLKNEDLASFHRVFTELESYSARLDKQLFETETSLWITEKLNKKVDVAKELSNSITKITKKTSKKGLKRSNTLYDNVPGAYVNNVVENLISFENVVVEDGLSSFVSTVSCLHQDNDNDSDCFSFSMISSMEIEDRDRTFTYDSKNSGKDRTFSSHDSIISSISEFSSIFHSDGKSPDSFLEQEMSAGFLDVPHMPSYDNYQNLLCKNTRSAVLPVLSYENNQKDFSELFDNIQSCPNTLTQKDTSTKQWISNTKRWSVDLSSGLHIIQSKVRGRGNFIRMPLYHPFYHECMALLQNRRNKDTQESNKTCISSIHNIQENEKNGNCIHRTSQHKVLYAAIKKAQCRDSYGYASMITIFKHFT